MIMLNGSVTGMLPKKLIVLGTVKTFERPRKYTEKLKR